MLMSGEQNAGENNIKTANESLDCVSKFRYFGAILNTFYMHDDELRGDYIQ
jgi:hypothetical protein